MTNADPGTSPGTKTGTTTGATTRAKTGTTTDASTGAKPRGAAAAAGTAEAGRIAPLAAKSDTTESAATDPAATVLLSRAAPPASPAVADSPPPAAAGRRRGGNAAVLLGCAVVAFVLHTLALLWNWWVWSAEPGARGWWMVITDLPVSLLYLHHTDGRLFLWSLLLGGLQWAATGALVAWAAWRVAGWRRRRR